MNGESNDKFEEYIMEDYDDIELTRFEVDYPVTIRALAGNRACETGPISKPITSSMSCMHLSFSDRYFS